MSKMDSGAGAMMCKYMRGEKKVDKNRNRGGLPKYWVSLIEKEEEK